MSETDFLFGIGRNDRAPAPAAPKEASAEASRPLYAKLADTKRSMVDLFNELDGSPARANLLCGAMCVRLGRIGTEVERVSEMLCPMPELVARQPRGLC